MPEPSYPYAAPEAAPAVPTVKKPAHPAVVIALVAIVLACLCGGGWWLFAGDDDPAAAPTTAPAKTSAATSPSPSTACLAVPAALLALIDDQAQTGTGLKMTGRAGAVRSPNHEKVFLVAAEFSATGVENQTGVWATNSLDSPDAIYSVDGMATQFTSWQDSSKVDGQLKYEPSVQQAKACVK